MQNGAKVKHAVGAALAVLLLGYAVLQVWVKQGNAQPEISWFTVGVLVLIGGLVLAGGWQIRSYRHHKAQRMPAPQVARRTVVAAQASALVGAALTGWYGAQAALAVQNLESDRLKSIAVIALCSAIAAAGLSVVGFVVQAWCRIDENDDDDKPRGGDTASVA